MWIKTCSGTWGWGEDGKRKQGSEVCHLSHTGLWQKQHKNKAYSSHLWASEQMRASLPHSFSLFSAPEGAAASLPLNDLIVGAGSSSWQLILCKGLSGGMAEERRGQCPISDSSLWWGPWSPWFKLIITNKYLCIHLMNIYQMTPLDSMWLRWHSSRKDDSDSCLWARRTGIVCPSSLALHWDKKGVWFLSIGWKGLEGGCGREV